jgi:preprotein translocase subunit YajC
MFSAMFSRLAVWADGAAAADSADAGGSLLTMVVPLLILVVVFYFFIIRPESKRKKAAARMRKELIVGDEITTIGGIVGRVVTIKDDTVTLETGAERSKVKIMRWAISSKGEQVSDK